MPEKVAAPERKPVSKEAAAWQEHVEVVRQLYSESLWETLSPDLVLAFWSLALPDILFPASRSDIRDRK